MPLLAPRYTVAAVYAGLFFGLGVYMPFFPVWLANRGFDASWIAFALALPMSIRLFTMPLGGLLADRTGRPRATLVAYAVMTALCFVGVALAPSALWMLVALGMAASFWQPSQPVLDAYAVTKRRQGLIDYGKVRLWGSLAFIGGNLAGGFLLGGLPHDAVIWFIVGSSVFTVLAALTLDEAPLPHKDHLPHVERVGAVLAVGIAAAALVQGSHAVLYAFASVHWHAIGLSDGTIGIMWAIGVVAEVLLFRVATRVTARLGPERLILLGGIAGIVRFGAMSLEPSVLLLPVLQMLHAATFGCTYLGTVELVARYAPARKAAGTQALAAWGTAIAMTSATLLSGVLWQRFGSGAFLLSVAMSAAGAVLAWAAYRMRQPQRAGSGG